MMPVTGGVSLIRAVRLLEPNVKVLATSGLIDQENHARLKELGVDGIIAKPCDPQELLSEIRRQLLRTGLVDEKPTTFEALDMVSV